MHKYKSILTDLFTDNEAVEHLAEICKITAKQRMSVVCFKNGSSEIIGILWNFVLSRDDHNYDAICRNVCK